MYFQPRRSGGGVHGRLIYGFLNLTSPHWGFGMFGISFLGLAPAGAAGYMPSPLSGLQSVGGFQFSFRCADVLSYYVSSHRLSARKTSVREMPGR